MNDSLQKERDAYNAYWKKVYRESTLDAITSIKEGARQLVTIISALEGLYLAALSFSEIQTTTQDLWLLALLAAPALPLLISQSLAVSLFVPKLSKPPDANENTWRRYVFFFVSKPSKPPGTSGNLKSEDIEGRYKAAMRNMLQRLKWAQRFFIISIIVLFTVAILYFALLKG